MARNKAIFDADILINMVRTKSLDFLITMFSQIYISDYVWNVEIREGSEEKRILRKMMNRGFLVLLDYKKLTDKQQFIYRQAYDILKYKAPDECLNEGERITASFAKAHNVAYYMSDDNKAAPYIRSLCDVAVINYCDLLFMSYSRDNKDVKLLESYYYNYLKLFDDECYPKSLMNKDRKPLDFPAIMAKSFDKFTNNKQLVDFLKLIQKDENYKL